MCIDRYIHIYTYILVCSPPCVFVEFAQSKHSGDAGGGRPLYIYTYIYVYMYRYMYRYIDTYIYLHPRLLASLCVIRVRPV